jgi:Lar family restriction alleviation protein
MDEQLNTMDTNILPCPFCGGTATAFEVESGQDFTPWYDWQVECDQCQCASPEVIASSPDGARLNAINAWNRRVP